MINWDDYGYKDRPQHVKPSMRLTPRGEVVLGVCCLLAFLALMALVGGIETGTLM